MEPETILQAQAKNWLGDYKTVDRLLRSLVKETLESKAKTGSEFSKKLDKSAREVAHVLLGYDDRFPPVPHWNIPGQIDEYVAKQEGIESDEPEERIAGALIRMVIQLRELAGTMETENVLPEQWQFQASGIIGQYVRLMLGLPKN